MASPRRRFPLVLRFILGLLASGLLLTVILFTWLQPRTAAAFQRLGDEFLADGSTTMHELAHEHSTHTSDQLVDALASSDNDRARSLGSLGLQRFGGDTAGILAAIRADDDLRRAHQMQEVATLSAAGQQRIEASIATRLRALARNQRTRTDMLVANLRTTHVLLVAAMLTILLGLLGVGIHRTVVTPTARLAATTRRIAGGDLGAEPPPATADEIGDLTRDFHDMLAQLRQAKAAQERMHANLADQVADKTRHLEQALQDLRSSHLQLAQAERLAALGTLAGGIAHEFHNVIGGIRGCALDLASDEPTPSRRETLAVILRATERASGIVQQLLRFARRSIESAAEFDPATVGYDALRLVEPAARRQRVAIESMLAPGLRLHGDADGIHQVLVNLLLNSLQAMPAGGTLRVQLDGDDDGIRFTVADNGVGIAEADLPHVFEPFFTTRGDDPDPTRRGSGLGLSVSWGIVTAHGGRIDVQSTRGVGTTFTVCLARHRPAGPDASGTTRTS